MCNPKFRLFSLWVRKVQKNVAIFILLLLSYFLEDKSVNLSTKNDFLVLAVSESCTILSNKTILIFSR